MTDIYDLYGILIATGETTEEEWDAALAEHDREVERAYVRRLAADLERLEAIGETRSGDLTEEEHRWYGQHPLAGEAPLDRIRAWITEREPADVEPPWTDPEPWVSVISTRTPKSRSRYQHDDFQAYRPRTRKAYDADMTQNGDPK